MNEQTPEAKALFELFQQPRISELERDFLRSIFKDNNEAIVALRDLFYGFELSEQDIKIIQDIGQHKEIRKLLRKIFIWELEKDIPVMQNRDLWLTKDISDATDETFNRIYDTKKLMIEMLEKSLKRLEDIKLPAPDLKIKKDFAHLSARNNYLLHVDGQLRVIVTLAYSEKETPEQVIERMRKNSSK